MEKDNCRYKSQWTYPFVSWACQKQTDGKVEHLNCNCKECLDYEEITTSITNNSLIVEIK